MESVIFVGSRILKSMQFSDKHTLIYIIAFALRIRALSSAIVLAHLSLCGASSAVSTWVVCVSSWPM